MKRTIRTRTVAFLLSFAMLFSMLSAPALAFGDFPGGMIPSDFSGDFGYLRYWFQNAPEAKEMPSEQTLNDIEKDLKSDSGNALKSTFFYYTADIGNKLLPAGGEKLGPWVSMKLLQYAEKLEKSGKSIPLFSNVGKKLSQLRRIQALKDYAKLAPDFFFKAGHNLAFGLDTFFCAKGFYDMYNEPKIGFKSSGLEFTGNAIRGASSAMSLLYRTTKDPRAAAVAIGLTALDAAYNSKIMVRAANSTMDFFNVKRIPILDDAAYGLNYTGFAIDEYLVALFDGNIVEKNNKLLEEMKKKCRGGTFQGRGVNVYKPNIYLYPAQETDVDVTFALPELLTVSEPLYENGWSVTAAPDGTLTDSGGEYGYLFYESITYPGLYQTTEGFVIPAKHREETFRSILEQYGLNEREIADFCDFWCDKLEDGKDYAMYPQLTETIDRAMPVTLSPAPDTTLRIWFAFAEGETPEAESKPTALERRGFTLVEWGGFFLTD